MGYKPPYQRLTSRWSTGTVECMDCGHYQLACWREGQCDDLACAECGERDTIASQAAVFEASEMPTPEEDFVIYSDHLKVH